MKIKTVLAASILSLLSVSAFAAEKGEHGAAPVGSELPTNAQTPAASKKHHRHHHHKKAAKAAEAAAAPAAKAPAAK